MYSTQFFETQVLNTLRGRDLPGYPEVYLGLFMSNPGNTGTQGIEVQYSGYERLPVTFSSPYNEAGNRGIRSNVDLLWEPSPIDIGQVRFIGLMSSQLVGTGDMLAYGELTSPLDVRANQQPSIQAGDALFFLVGNASDSFKDRILNVLRGTQLDGFNPHWALFNGDPTQGGAELSGGAYARPSMSFSTPEVTAGEAMHIQNSNLVRFPAPTMPWGLWAWDCIMTAETGGEIVIQLPNPVPETILRNYVPQIRPGYYRVAMN